MRLGLIQNLQHFVPQLEHNTSISLLTQTENSSCSFSLLRRVEKDCYYLLLGTESVCELALLPFFNVVVKVISELLRL